MLDYSILEDEEYCKARGKVRRLNCVFRNEIVKVRLKFCYDLF